MLNKGKAVKIVAILVFSGLFVGNALLEWGMIAELDERIVYLSVELYDRTNYLAGMIEQLMTDQGNSIQMGVEIHVTMKHYRDGVLIAQSHHAGTLTTIGKNWIEDQLGDTPSNDPAKWIALSNSTDAPAAGWSVLPAEITTGDMERAAGTYANVGDGQWNITNSFSPSETNSTQLTGLYYANAGNFLLAADTVNLINYENGDTVEITWTITVS